MNNHQKNITNIANEAIDAKAANISARIAAARRGARTPRGAEHLCSAGQALRKHAKPFFKSAAAS